VTGKLNPPLLTAAQAGSLLDQVIFEQVLECIDLDALFRVEQSITMIVGELDGIADDQITETTTVMLDRALLRLPANLRSYLSAAAWPLPDCRLCEANEADERSIKPGRESEVPIRRNRPLRFDS